MGGMGVEAQEGGGLRTQLADSHCCTAETQDYKANIFQFKELN